MKVTCPNCKYYINKRCYSPVSSLSPEYDPGGYFYYYCDGFTTKKPKVKTEMNITNHRIEMFESLTSAIHKAGGRVPAYKQLKSMTFEEMLEQYAQNGIRFTFDESAMKR